MNVDYEQRFSNKDTGCERPHRHDYAVLSTVIGGQVELNVRGVSVSLIPGILCLIPPDTLHHVVSFSASFCGVHTLSVLKLPDGLKSMMQRLPRREILIRDEAVCAEFIRLDTARSVEDFLSEVSLYGSMPAIQEGASSRHWTAVCIKDFLDSDREAMDASSFIENTLPHTKTHCNRLFKAAYGTTIQSYQLAQKAERARVLLQSDRPLSEVALEAGFYDQSHMTRIFKGVFQLTPEAYRAQHRE
ncbi:helix-turn-helix transcriptional regulator [Pontiella agarivorans]|uniref:Helix-turn-helix transcriptional regulator n=1 Tax=Pontiella agarivorans TaxID=3038953 RepID=A0ABU5MVW6_9BACT|nr:helix-turn-helix transcriptional regulator [Pontiella agarivorans]MDZ8118231.1 helix-turn-helix transcriptional regulator [Pontiella agarivorans]